jgi:hypothetical protein
MCDQLKQIDADEQQARQQAQAAPNDAEAAQQLVKVRRTRWNHCDVCQHCHAVTV